MLEQAAVPFPEIKRWHSLAVGHGCGLGPSGFSLCSFDPSKTRGHKWNLSLSHEGSSNWSYQLPKSPPLKISDGTRHFSNVCNISNVVNVVHGNWSDNHCN